MKTAILAAIATAMLACTAQAEHLFLDGDIVRGAQVGAPGPVCVLNNQFKHLEKVVFRFRVRDASGKVLDDKGLKSLDVQLPDGQTVKGYYGGHPPVSQSNPEGPTDFFWVAVWIIPSGYPNGTFRYKALATDMAGNTEVWEPIRRITSEPQVMPGEIEFKKP